MTKNKNVAAIISFFLAGLGQLYLGNYVRGIASFLISGIVSYIFIMLAGTTVGMIISLLFSVYYAYDAIECTDAVNNNTSAPKLFTVLEI